MVRDVPDKTDTNWYFGTWAMRQFYMVYKLESTADDIKSYISILNSVEKSVNNYKDDD